MGTIQLRLESGLPLARFTVAIAAFILFLEGRDHHGRVLKFHDPQSETLITLIQQANSSSHGIVRALLSRRDIFGDLITNDTAIREIADAYDHIKSIGLETALKS